MPISAVQFVLALPLFIAGVGWFFGALRNPLRAGLLGLSFFSFCLQFLLGIMLFPFTWQGYEFIEAGDVVLAFGVIYVFWLSVAIISSLWKTPLEYVEIEQREGIGGGRGIFANLVSSSLRMNVAGFIAIYGLMVIVRLWIMIKYKFGISGTWHGVIQNVPYFIISISLILHSAALAFLLVSAVQLFHKRSGTLLNTAIIIIELLFAFARGRRVMFIAVLLLLFALICRQGKTRIKHLLLGTVFAVLGLQVIFPLFYYMRSEWQRGEWFLPNLLTVAVQRSVTERDVYNQVVKDRLLALKVNYLIASRLKSGVPKTGGEFLVVGVGSAVPRVLYPNKFLREWEPDVLLDNLVGLGGEQRQDTFSNVGMFALADFGWLVGGIVYGFVFVTVLRFVEIIIKLLSRRSPLGSVICFSVIASCPVMQMEFTVNDLMVSLRTILIVCMFFYLWETLFVRRSPQITEQMLYEGFWDGQD